LLGSHSPADLGLDPLEIDAFKLFLVAIGTSLSR
jgi:hypothetical protein